MVKISNDVVWMVIKANNAFKVQRPGATAIGSVQQVGLEDVNLGGGVSSKVGNHNGVDIGAGLVGGGVSDGVGGDVSLSESDGGVGAGAEQVLLRLYEQRATEVEQCETTSRVLSEDMLKHPWLDMGDNYDFKYTDREYEVVMLKKERGEKEAKCPEREEKGPKSLNYINKRTDYQRIEYENHYLKSKILRANSNYSMGDPKQQKLGR